MISAPTCEDKAINEPPLGPFGVRGLCAVVLLGELLLEGSELLWGPRFGLCSWGIADVFQCSTTRREPNWE